MNAKKNSWKLKKDNRNFLNARKNLGSKKNTEKIILEC